MRYVLIDYMHLAHRCIAAQPLSTNVMVNNELKLIDTTIPNYTIKNVVSYGGRGMFHTGVFFEGGASARKKYFSAESSGDGSGYKGNRGSHKGSFYEGIDLAIQMMLNGKVSLYRCEGFEADDLIYAMVQKIKETDTTTPIDIITNDSDLLPLVDEQVSVYIRGTREYNEDDAPVRRLYYQVTPRSWEEYLSYTSAYKEFKIPYNSMLLYKMIRGDKSDNIAPACKGYGGAKYSEVMEEMSNAVFMNKNMENILKKKFVAKQEELVDIAKLKSNIAARYTQKDAEKFITMVEQKLTGKALTAKNETYLVNTVEKAGLGDILDFEVLKQIQSDLGKWFDFKSLIEMNAAGVDLVTELKTVLMKYFTPQDISEMYHEGLDVDKLFTLGVDFANIFRYGVDFDTVMLPVLEKWFKPEELEKMKFIYKGICLRRQELVLPKQIDSGFLQQALQPLKINILKVK